MIRSLSCLLFAALACAGEAVVTPEPPYLGVELEAVADQPPLRVVSVVPGATADRLGLKPGDRVTAIGDIQVSTTADMAAAVSMLTAGSPLRVAVSRGGSSLVLEGAVEAMPRPRQLLTDADKLRGDIAKLKEDGERVRLQAELQDCLRVLARLQEGLPKMAEEFKRLYPTGTFSVQIHIDVRSEPTAAVQVPLKPTPEKP